MSLSIEQMMQQAMYSGDTFESLEKKFPAWAMSKEHKEKAEDYLREMKATQEFIELSATNLALKQRKHKVNKRGTNYTPPRKKRKKRR